MKPSQIVIHPPSGMGKTVSRTASQHVGNWVHRDARVKDDITGRTGRRPPWQWSCTQFRPGPL